MFQVNLAKNQEFFEYQKDLIHPATPVSGILQYELTHPHIDEYILLSSISNAIELINRNPNKYVRHIDYANQTIFYSVTMNISYESTPYEFNQYLISRVGINKALRSLPNVSFLNIIPEETDDQGGIWGESCHIEIGIKL